MTWCSENPWIVFNLTVLRLQTNTLWVWFFSQILPKVTVCPTLWKIPHPNHPQRDRIKYLGSLVFPPLHLFFHFSFSCQPLSPRAFVEPCAPSTNSSGVQPKKRQREAGGGGETERTSRRESERAENFEMCGGFPAVEQNWTVATFSLLGFFYLEPPEQKLHTRSDTGVSYEAGVALK